MNILHYVTLICATGILGACSSTPPVAAPAAVANADGTYSLTQNGVTRDILAPVGTSGGTSLQYWNDLGGNEVGYMYESADVIAIAVMDTTSNETFAGIAGTAASSVPTGGSGTYNGDFSAVYFRNGVTNAPWLARGAFTTTINFGSTVVTGSGTGNFSSDLAISGTVSGTEISGNATFSATDYSGAATVPMNGGLYTNGTVAGVYQGTAVTGVFWGQ